MVTRYPEVLEGVGPQGESGLGNGYDQPRGTLGGRGWWNDIHVRARTVRHHSSSPWPPPMHPSMPTVLRTSLSALPVSGSTLHRDGALSSVRASRDLRDRFSASRRRDRCGGGGRRPAVRRMRRKLITSLVVAGLFAAGFGASVLPASADQRSVVLYLRRRRPADRDRRRATLHPDPAARAARLHDHGGLRHRSQPCGLLAAHHRRAGSAGRADRSDDGHDRTRARAADRGPRAGDRRRRRTAADLHRAPCDQAAASQVGRQGRQ